MKSVAGRLLESLNPTPKAVPIVEGAVTQEKLVTSPVIEATPKEDEPAAKEEPKGGKDSEGDDQMAKMKKVMENHMCDPDGMANMLECMGGYMEAYHNEADDKTYTAKDPAEKEDLQQAQAHMSEAMLKLRGKKMIKKK